MQLFHGSGGTATSAAIMKSISCIFRVGELWQQTGLAIFVVKFDDYYHTLKKCES